MSKEVQMTASFFLMDEHATEDNLRSMEDSWSRWLGSDMAVTDVAFVDAFFVKEDQ